MQQLYAEGGVRAFWTGNGLSVIKILPESAIKFFSYETSVSISLHFGGWDLFPSPSSLRLVCLNRRP